MEKNGSGVSAPGHDTELIPTHTHNLSMVPLFLSIDVIWYYCPLGVSKSRSDVSSSVWCGSAWKEIGE